MGDCVLSLVIPAYNEAEGIRQAIEEADDALSRFGGSYEILIVDDGSSDATAENIAQAQLHRPNVRMLRHPANQGYGSALRTGFENARGQWIAFTDADRQFYLEDLGSLLARADRYPLVVGYRVDRQDPWSRRFFSKGYNFLARSLLGTRVRDCDCALKVFQRQVLTGLLPESRGYFVNTEMLTLARQQGLEVAEVGVRHRPRVQGESKVSLSDIPKTLKTFIPFWWSRVLFPGVPPLTRRAPRNVLRLRRSTLYALFLGIMAVLLFFARLKSPLLEPEEARYAEIPRQMLAEGHFLTPVLHGEPYLHKPPLLYWLVMASYQAFGVHDWAARLVPSGAGVLIVLLTFWWGKHTLGTGPALAGGAILCLSARFLYLGGMLAMDSLLCLWVVAALGAGHRALVKSPPDLHRFWWCLSALACGLGILTKGPVALVLVLMPMAAISWLDTRCARVLPKHWLAYVGMVFAVALPWYGAMAWQYPKAIRDFFWLHNVSRFLAPLDHEKPAWFYLPDLFLGLAPWTLLGIPLVPYLTRGSQSGRNRPRALGFFLLASLVCLAFYSISGCKRVGYILPAFPPLALVLGTMLAGALRVERKMWSAMRRARSAEGAELGDPHSALGAPGSPLHVLGRRAIGLIVALSIGMAILAAGAGLVPWIKTLVGSLFLVALGLALTAWTRQRPAWFSWSLCGMLAFVILWAGVHHLLPNYHRKFALRGQVRQYLNLQDLPVACYPKRWDSISYYLGRDDVQVFTRENCPQLLAYLQAQGQTLFFVKADHSLQEIEKLLAPELEFVPQGRQGERMISGLVRPNEKWSGRTCSPGKPGG